MIGVLVEGCGLWTLEGLDSTGSGGRDKEVNPWLSVSVLDMWSWVVWCRVRTPVFWA